MPAHRSASKAAVNAAVTLCAAAAFSVPTAVGATTLSVEIDLPKIDTSPYYRPYLAAWIEDPKDKSMVTTLSVLYDTRIKNNIGRGWLRNLKTWWRKGGEALALPVDGISGATRPAGTHTVRFDERSEVLAKLSPANYQLVVEVAREHGGHDLLRMPFDWSGARTTKQKLSAQGEGELGEVRMAILP